MSRARLDPAAWRAAAWAWRVMRRLRRDLAEHGLDAVPPALPPSLPEAAWPGAASVLDRARATCLERAMVTQAWALAHGHRRDVVIGVTAPGRGFRAHAWMEGDDVCHHAGFSELTRLSRRAAS